MPETTNNTNKAGRVKKTTLMLPAPKGISYEEWQAVNGPDLSGIFSRARIPMMVPEDRPGLDLVPLGHAQVEGIVETARLMLENHGAVGFKRIEKFLHNEAQKATRLGRDMLGEREFKDYMREMWEHLQDIEESEPERVAELGFNDMTLSPCQRIEFGFSNLLLDYIEVLKKELIAQEKHEKIYEDKLRGYDACKDVLSQGYPDDFVDTFDFIVRFQGRETAEEMLRAGDMFDKANLPALIELGAQPGLHARVIFRDKFVSTFLEGVDHGQEWTEARNNVIEQQKDIEARIYLFETLKTDEPFRVYMRALANTTYIESAARLPELAQMAALEEQNDEKRPFRL